MNTLLNLLSIRKVIITYFTVRAEEFPKEGLKWSKMIKKQDGSYIKNITDVTENDEVKLFGRGTQTQSILMLTMLHSKKMLST